MILGFWEPKLLLIFVYYIFHNFGSVSLHPIYTQHELVEILTNKCLNYHLVKLHEK